jgi:hypothetical protein
MKRLALGVMAVGTAGIAATLLLPNVASTQPTSTNPFIAVGVSGSNDSSHAWFMGKRTNTGQLYPVVCTKSGGAKPVCEDAAFPP